MNGIEEQRPGYKPIPEETVWGFVGAMNQPVVCSLLVDGQCPKGCAKCAEFEREMNRQNENIQTGLQDIK